MLNSEDLLNFVKEHIDKDECLSYAAAVERKPSARIKETLQGCGGLALALGIFLFMHEFKRNAHEHEIGFEQRVAIFGAFLLIGSFIFILYSFFQYRASNRRLWAITDRRILRFDFNDVLTSKTMHAARAKLTEIPLTQIKSFETLQQSDGSGVLILKVSGDDDRSLKRVQIEVSNVKLVSSTLSEGLKLLRGL